MAEEEDMLLEGTEQGEKLANVATFNESLGFQLRASNDTLVHFHLLT